MRHPTLDPKLNDERREQARLDDWAAQVSDDEMSEMYRYMLDNPSEF